MVVRQSDSAARYGLIFSVLIIGAIIAEPVIIAVVPEPCGKRMMTPMMIGTKIPGTPAATIASAIIFAAPVVAFRAKCKMFSRHLQKPILKTEKRRFKGL